MSNLKKVISLLLCLSMLAGMVAILDGAFVPTASAASAEPVTHKIKTMEQLTAEYGDKGFYYLGLEFYESNGKPTDGYVKPGDTLEVRVYVKSSFYIKTLTNHYVFENNFFDVTNGKTYTTSDKATLNSDYAITDSVGDVGLKISTWKTEAATALNSAKIGIPVETLQGWDLCEVTNLMRGDGTANLKRNFRLDQDKYICSFNVTVKSDLAEGTVGSSILTNDMFQIYEKSIEGAKINTQRKGDVTLSTSESATAQKMFNFDGITFDNFDIADCNYTFVIGENPNPEGKYSANFVIGDTTDTKFYAPGETVAVPDAGDNFIGWANTATGKVEDTSALVMGEKNITYKAVYTTDTFDVTVDFDGGNVDGETSKTVKAAYGSTVDLSGITPVKAGYEFMGWNPATTTVDNINGITVKAVWSATEYSINFMVMDYATGSWKLADTKTGTVASTALAYADITKVGNALTGNDIGWSDNFKVATYSFDEADSSEQRIRNNATVAFDGDKTVYIHTQIQYDVTLTIPVYDAATGSYVAPAEPQIKNQLFDGEKDTGVCLIAPTNIMSLVVPKDGFTFKQWIDNSTGEKATNARANNYSFDVTKANGPTLSYTAEIGLKEYEIRFNMGNNEAYATLKLHKGDTIDLDKLTYYTNRSNPTTVYLPQVGVEASEQKTASWKDPGNVFRGWSVESSIRNLSTKEELDNATFIEFPVTLDDELMKKVITESSTGIEYIKFYDGWETLNYEIRFHIITAESYPEYDTELYRTTLAPCGANMLKFAGITAEDSQAVSAKAIEGKVFSKWAPAKEGGNLPSYVPMGGIDLYAQYLDQTYNVYVDYANGKDTTLKLWSIGGATYGVDIETAPDEEGKGAGEGYRIRHDPITEFNKPEGNYEIIGWKVYHFDNPEDVNDPIKWREGYNDEGTQVAKSCILYQAEWIDQNDLLFRVYSSNGKLYSAMSKKLKMYYWTNDTCCSKGEGKLNYHGDSFFIAFYKITLENWDWNGFFKPEMWQSVSLRFDAFALRKDTFSPEGIKGLIEMIINLIKGDPGTGDISGT